MEELIQFYMLEPEEQTSLLLLFADSDLEKWEVEHSFWIRDPHTGCLVMVEDPTPH